MLRMMGKGVGEGGKQVLGLRVSICKFGRLVCISGYYLYDTRRSGRQEDSITLDRNGSSRMLSGVENTLCPTHI